MHDVIRWRSGVVLRERSRWGRAVEYAVRLTSEGDAREVPALAYPDLVGTPRAGDEVLLNVTALDRGLGTGGLALVVAVPDRLPPDPPPGPSWPPA